MKTSTKEIKSILASDRFFLLKPSKISLSTKELRKKISLFIPNPIKLKSTTLYLIHRQNLLKQQIKKTKTKKQFKCTLLK